MDRSFEENIAFKRVLNDKKLRKLYTAEYISGKEFIDTIMPYYYYDNE